jgi:hypothetical protein
MPIAFAKTYQLPEFRSIRLIGTLTFSGSYAVNGEVPTGLIKPGTTKNPILVNFYNRTANEYQYDPATGKILVFAPGGAELTAAAYPAGVTGDLVTIELEYPKFG